MGQGKGGEQGKQQGRTNHRTGSGKRMARSKL
jgi:hypothetical protein